MEAEIIERDGQVFIERICPEHGEFSYLYWDDADTYRRFDSYGEKGSGLENPQVVTSTSNCPQDCGICNHHHSTTLLANIDLTNRCNLNCEFCFANARACGYIYEPTFDQVKGMLTLLRNEKPNPAPAVQFAGGEPTLREDLLDIIRMAKEMGFLQVQLATNGLLLAKNPELIIKLKEAGLQTVYLHFDGVTKETNTKLFQDLKVVENCKKVGLGMVLVPTIIKTKNDHEVGAIIRYAAENVSVIRGINFQPVSFTGAASPDEITRERITVPELLQKIEEQTEGIILKKDFYPVPCVVPISEFVEVYTGKTQIKFTAHQHCGAATYVFVKEEGIVPINRMVDVDAFFKSIEELTKRLENSSSLSKKMVAISGMREFYNNLKKDGSNTMPDLWRILGKTLISHNFEALRSFHWNALFIGTMHFMDNYNYDTDRVNRCCIHYATPDGRLIPFCSYNSGPVYREQVWSKYKKSE